MTRAARGSDFAAEMRRQQFSALLKLSPLGIVVLDTDGLIREWNPAAVDLLGWGRDEVLGQPLPGLAPAAHGEEFARLWGDLQATRQAGSVSSSHLHRDGIHVPVEVYMAPIQDMDGSFAGVVATLRRQEDPTETVGGGFRPTFVMPEQSRPLFNALELDDLTGLPGRRWLQQRLTAALPLGEERAVAVLDVDAFALVNQGYGPEAGDAVLHELAGRLVSVPGVTALGRWQADEFVCIVDGKGAAATLDEAVRLLATVAREPFALGEERLRLTVSVGLASSSGLALPMLFRSASAAMAAAKARGRDCAVWFDAAMTPEVGGSGLRMANDLQRALDEGELRLHFQPIVDLLTNDIDGVEALVRWEKAGVGLLTPDAFVEIAERTGQIVALGEWVFTQACRAAVDLEVVRLSPVRVSVNVSARQLSDPGLVRMLSDALTRTGCAPDRIAIEVTETSVLHDIGAATAVLEAIKALGVELDLDDFGTGYSSLLYLRHFPVDRIKIDRSFVSGLGSSVADTAIVASTIALAHSVGLRAIAEGVETSQQLTLLRQMGCDFAQGFLLSPPLPAQELVPWLQQQLPSRLVERLTGPVGSDGLAHRESAANQRDHLSDQRDEIADLRDLVADEREAQANLRDSAASALTRDPGSPAAQEATALQEGREESAAARQEAAADRILASQDRVVGAGDRLQAGQDRTKATANREATSQVRSTSTFDALTGAYLKDAGLEALRAELAAAVRDGQPLTLVHVAVDGQAAGPQNEGQLGADALLVVVANGLGTRLRETDLLVRGGPSHFLCALKGLTASAAAELMVSLETELQEPPHLVALRLGYAELRPDESARRLIERAKPARRR